MNKKDLSCINSLSDLQREIALLKSRIVVEEQVLGRRYSKLPAEIKKFVIKKVVPAPFRRKKLLDFFKNKD